MADPGGPNGTLTFVLDDGPSGEPPIAPRPPARRGFWARLLGWLGRPRSLRGRPRPRERRRLKRPHPIRWLGNLLVYLAAADPENIGSRTERYRYITVGLLMLVTAAQAFYAATLFFSISLGKPFRHELVYGVFFALAVYLIDRSIISYAAPIKLDKSGNLARPKKASGVLAIRVVIALVAAMLMSEMILLQVFAGDIKLQIQNDHLAVTQTTDNKIEANYQGQIAKLQGQINNAQAVVNQRQSDVQADYRAMNCQEFGCPGIAAGIGPGFAAAQQTFRNAQQRLTDAQGQLQAIQQKNLPRIQQLNTAEQQAINGAQPAITNADKVLSQEEAFWQLTVKNGTVLVVRVLLSLLILGIDLAPILFKLTGRTSLHDIRAHSSDYVATEKNKHETNTAVHRLAKQGHVDKSAYDLEMDSKLYDAEEGADVARTRIKGRADVARAEAKANAEVDLYGIRLDTSLRKLEHHHRYMARKSAFSAGQRGGHGGWPGGGMGGQAGPSPEPDPNPGAGPARAAFPQIAPPVADQDDPAPPEPDDPDAPVVPDFDPDRVDSEEIDEYVEIVLHPEEPTGMLVLDHKWVLHDRLPQADLGGGGIVWRAKDQLSDQRIWYVVKTVPSGLVDKRTTQYIQQLGVRHEQRVSGVVHNHLGEIIHHGDDRGFSYLVYPLYEPGSLALYCRRLGDQRPLGWCARIIDEVLSGLMAAFAAADLVHLDIKPGNIVLDGDHARVIDWGLSRVWNASQPSTWIVRGTPFYACPEQLIELREGWDTPRADLYSVGATFYWLLTNEAPLQYDARGLHDLLEYRKLLVSGVRPQPVHELVPGVPRPLSALIDRWLSFDPAGRVPPGTLMADCLRSARDELDALRPLLPEMMVGQVTGRRRRGRN